MKVNPKNYYKVIETAHLEKGFRFVVGMALILLLGATTACKTATDVVLEQDDLYPKFKAQEVELSQFSGDGKFRRIDHFLSEWKQKFEKHSLYAKIQKEQEHLRNYIEETLAAELRGTEENVMLNAKTNVERAKARKQAYEHAMNQYPDGKRWTELAKKGSEAETNKRDWEKYLELENSYYRICQSSEQEKLKLCFVAFFTHPDWTPDNFPKKKKYIEEIKKQEQELKLKLLRRLSLSEKKPATDNFKAMKEYYENRSKALQDYISYFPPSSTEYDQRRSEKNVADREKMKYARWCELVAKANLIIAKDKLPNKNNERLLLQIQSFFKDFPQDEYSEKDLESYFEQIKDIQNRAASVICSRLDSLIEQNRPEDVTRSNRPKVYEANAQKIEENLSYLKGAADYDFYKEQKDKFNEMALILKSENSFYDALENLTATLKNEKKTPQEKMHAIDVFCNNHTRFRDNYPKKFEEIANRRRELEAEHTFEDKIQKVPETPSDSKKLPMYKKECERILEDIGYFKSWPHLKEKVRSAENSLKQKIKWVTGKIGKGSYTDVLNSEDSYKEDSTEDNYKKLCVAIAAFEKASENIENMQYIESVKAIKRNSQAYHEIQEAYNAFLKNMDQAQWEDFSIRARKQEKPTELPGYSREYYDIWLKLMPFVGGQKKITVNLLAWNFLGTKFYKRWGADCRVWISKEKSQPSDLHCLSIRGGNWDVNDDKYRKDTDRTISTPVPSNISFILFSNPDRGQVSQKIPIKIYQILVEGRKKGECVLEIQDTVPGGGSVTLEFKDLPKFSAQNEPEDENSVEDQAASDSEPEDQENQSGS